MAMDTQSDAHHYTACDARAAEHYCLNGGSCIHVVALAQDTCQCPASYWGDRCELYRYNTGENQPNDPTPAIILGCMSAFILLLCVLVAIIYIRTRKKLPSGGRIDVGRDVEAIHSSEDDLPGNNNQNTKIQLQELIVKDKQTTNYSKIANDPEVTSEDHRGASSEEVAPLNSNCNRSTTSSFSLYYPKQSTV